HEIVFTSRGEQLPKGEEDFLHTVDLVGNPSLDLDLFTMKLLMNRYGGSFQYLRNETAKTNIWVFKFKIPKNIDN
ncbi:MAG: hypothetical protein ACTSV2_17810, partial [Candidatus Thorarchaeota archaeon]